MPNARYSSLAREDIDAAAAYIATDNPTAARRFQKAVRTTIRLIVRFPEMGAAYSHPDHLGLRAKLVSGFKNHVIFYTVAEGRPYIVRVLHGAREIPRVLDQKGVHPGT
jgi:toxin ParE1/3/4